MLGKCHGKRLHYTLMASSLMEIYFAVSVLYILGTLGVQVPRMERLPSPSITKTFCIYLVVLLSTLVQWWSVSCWMELVTSLSTGPLLQWCYFHFKIQVKLEVKIKIKIFLLVYLNSGIVAALLGRDSPHSSCYHLPIEHKIKHVVVVVELLLIWTCLPGWGVERVYPPF